MAKMTLIEALNKMLKISEERLAKAKEKRDLWSIKHYKNDIKIIKKQLTD
jgi:hypothetical protein